MGLGLLNMFVIDLLKIVALVGTGSGWRFKPLNPGSEYSKLPREETTCSIAAYMRPKLYGCIRHSEPAPIPHQAGRDLTHHAHTEPAAPVLREKRGADRAPAPGAHLPVTVAVFLCAVVGRGSTRVHLLRIAVSSSRRGFMGSSALWWRTIRLVPART